MKKIFLYKMSYFPEPHSHRKTKIKVDLDLSNYSTKADLKGATGADTSNLAVKSDVTSLKDEVNNIDVDKLKTVPVNLSKLSHVVKKCC